MNNKPKLRFPEFTDAWEQRKLDDILNERHILSKISDEYPRLSFTIEEGVIDPEDRKTNKRDFLMKDEANKKFLLTEVGDIIYNPANVVFGAIHRNSYGKGCLSPIYRIFETTQESRFLECVVRSKTFISKLAQKTEGSVVKLKTLKPEAFLEMTVSVSSSLDEQTKIADFFEGIDNLITLHQRKLDIIKEYKTGMLHKMFPKEGELIPEIRFPGFTGAWEQRKFGDIAQRQSETMVSDDDNPCVEYEDVIAEQGALNKDIFAKCVYKNGIRFTPEDVLYGKLRPYLHNWLNPDFTGVAVGDWWVLRPLDADKNFLFRLLQTSKYDDAANQSSGTKMPRADWKLISNMEFEIPATIEEQIKIAGVFDNLDNLITLHQRKLDEIKEYKRGLLQQMFA